MGMKELTKSVSNYGTEISVVFAYIYNFVNVDKLAVKSVFP
jgi:hypothetical protein